MKVISLPYAHTILAVHFCGDYGIVLVERLSGLGPTSPRYYTYRIHDGHVTPDGKYACEFGRHYTLLSEAIDSFDERTRDLLDAVRGIA